MSAATDALAAGLDALAEAVRAACDDPVDAIRLLSDMAAYQAETPPSAAPLGQAVTAAATVTAALCRRAALASLARACAAYEPVSYEDAIAVRDAVADLMDAESQVAADAGDLNAYAALRALRAAVVRDLTVRAAQLPRLVVVTRRAPLPAAVIAYQLYGDATRADDLVRRVDPPHPSFMPLTFTALSD